MTRLIDTFLIDEPKRFISITLPMDEQHITLPFVANSEDGKLAVLVFEARRRKRGTTRRERRK